MVEHKPSTNRARARTAKLPVIDEKALVGRFYDLQRETAVPEPYVLTEDITISPLTRAQFVALGDAGNDEEAQNRAMLGQQYDAVVALFQDAPQAVWNAFTVDLSKHMFGLGVEQAPGKSEESSSS